MWLTIATQLSTILQVLSRNGIKVVGACTMWSRLIKDTALGLRLASFQSFGESVNDYSGICHVALSFVNS